MKKYKENREFFLGVFVILRSIAVLIMIFVAVMTGESSHFGKAGEMLLPAIMSMVGVVLLWGVEDMIKEDIKKQQDEVVEN